MAGASKRMSGVVKGRFAAALYYMRKKNRERREQPQPKPEPPKED